MEPVLVGNVVEVVDVVVVDVVEVLVVVVEALAAVAVKFLPVTSALLTVTEVLEAEKVYPVNVGVTV